MEQEEITIVKEYPASFIAKLRNMNWMDRLFDYKVGEMVTILEEGKSSLLYKNYKTGYLTCAIFDHFIGKTELTIKVI